MSIQIRKATESDIPSIIDTYFDAFRDHPLTLRAFFPGSEPVRQWWAEGIGADLRDPSTHYLVVTDSASADPERILAFGKWRVWLTSTTPPAPPIPSWPEGADVPLLEKFFGAIDQKHKDILQDRPHWYLDMLGVRKEAQGKGVGTRLVEYGVTKADEARVEAFLAASPAGAPLYQKYGFEIHSTLPMGENGRVETFMLRPAKKA
ncbi:acyl-CoA N-acyltransferase [Annulohypoxylon maeteangense]|uniref:acyl-CoA N-acyltransferase n=1 Tax=Annulohypoxylon maeteangense TaxID=1927788 RepID=UPI0020078DC6|nr:acyl-CoA N-acyltransferase [Annulohypoxylon maeteangense]KAI0883044.1 acyl-CoA N-acyltransferase [Annulohypoxylon maeteangense]